MAGGRERFDYHDLSDGGFLSLLAFEDKGMPATTKF